jgi:hypothetical protein
MVTHIDFLLNSSSIFSNRRRCRRREKIIEKQSKDLTYDAIQTFDAFDEIEGYDAQKYAKLIDRSI